MNSRLVDGQRVYVRRGNGCYVLEVGAEIVAQIKKTYHGYSWILSPQRGRQWHHEKTPRKAIEGAYREWKSLGIPVEE